MKRRLFSFFLALVMVLGLIPAVSATGSPVLGVRESDWTGSSFQVENHFQNPMYVQYHFNKRVSFFYGTQSSNQLLTGITDVYAADPSILEIDEPEITPSGEHIYYFTGKQLGSTTLTVETISGTYTMPVEVVYPAMGAYTQPVLDLNYFIEREFAYSDTNKVFYFFSDFQLTNCTVEKAFEDNFDIVISNDESHAIVTIKDFNGLDGECPRFECSGIDTFGNPRNAGSHYVTFVDGAETIGYVDTWYDNNQLIYEDQFYKQLDLDMGNSTRIAFGYGNSANYNLLTNVLDVTSEDEGIATVELRDEDGKVKIWQIQSESLGSTYLKVETASGTYRMPINVEMPRLGMFSQPERKAEYLLTHGFTYTDTSKTFYLIYDGSKDRTITDAWTNDPSFNSNFRFTLEKTNCIRVDIVDTDGLSGEWLEFRCQLADANGNSSGYGTYGVGVDFIDGTPAPGYRRIEWQGDEIYASGDFRSTISHSIGQRPGVIFYHGTANNHAPMDVASVAVVDPSIAVIEYWRDTGDGLPAYQLRFLKLGNTDIIVTTTDGQTHNIPIRVVLDVAYFFSEPVCDEQYLITSFDVTSQNDTFYYACQQGWTLNQVVVNEDCASAFDITYSADRTCATIKVLSPSQLPTWDIQFRIDMHSSTRDTTTYYNFPVRNAVPSPGFRHIEWQYNEIVPHGEFESSISDSPGSSPSLVFYHGTSDNYSPLDVDSVTVANTSIADVKYWRDTQNGLPAYEVVLKTPGSTEIIVKTTDSKEYRIPVEVRIIAGYFFTQPQFDTQYVSSSYDITNIGDTFYFVLDSEFNLEEIAPDQDYADAFEITYAPNKAYAAIKVVKPSMLPNARVFFDVYLNDGDRSWRNSYGVWLNNEIPSLIAEYVDFMNDQVHPLGEYITTMDQSLYSYPAFLFHYGTYANSTPITGITSVTLSDPSLATITSETDSSGVTVWFLDPQKAGSTTLTVTAASGTYTMPVTIDFPYLGVYSQPIRSADTLLRHGVEWTDTNKTFYLMLRNPNEVITGVSASSFNSNFNYTVAGDGSYVKVEIVDTTGLDNAYTDFTANISDSNGGSWQNRVGCSIINGNDTIGWVDVWYPPSDNLELGNESYKLLDWWLGDADNITFAYGTRDNYSLLKNVTNITSENTDIITLEWEILADGTVYCVPACVGLGNTHIRIETTTDTYRLPVEVILPPLAAFTQPTGDPQHMIQEFPFTNINNTFYLMLNVNHATIADIYPEDDSLSGHFRFTFTPGDQYAKVEIIDPEALHDMWIEFRCQLGDTNGDPSGLGTFGMRAVHFVDNTPIAPLPNAPVTPIHRPSWSHSGPGLPSDLNEGDQLYVSVPVENKTATDQEITAMLAIYNDSGKMLALRSGTITIPANGSDNVSLDVDLTGIHNADHAKLFMTDGNLLPVSTVFTLS